MFTKQGPRVAAEAAALEAAGHPGLVELVDAAGGTLRTRRIEGARPLADAAPLSDDEIAGVLASVASTLADLHAGGVVHGGIDATHVLLHPEGRTVLCSLGRGGTPADDVAALGRLIRDLLASAPPAQAEAPGTTKRQLRRRAAERVPALLASPVAPVLAELVSRAIAADPAARPTARELATAVHQRVATARLPKPAGPAPLLARPTGGNRRRKPTPISSRQVGGLLGLALLVLAGTTFAPSGVSHPDPRPPATDPTTSQPPSTTSTTTAAAAAVRVWPVDRLAYEGGVLTVDGVRYALGKPGDAVVAGDWTCAGRRTVALLRPPTGEVFAFDTWAGADEVPGRLVGTVEGATGLRAVPGDDGCDDIEVARPGGDPVLVDAGRIR